MAIKNPFAKDAQGEMNLPRNEQDLSRQSLYTTEWGRLDPVFVQEVIPGDTAVIKDCSLAIQGMPTVFPLQTRCRVSVQFYYGRNRCVHDEFEDFIFRTKDIQAPFIRTDLSDPTRKEQAKKMFRTGSLADFFGCATTKGTADSSNFNIRFSLPLYDSNRPLYVTHDINYLLRSFSPGRFPGYIPGQPFSNVYNYGYNANATSSFIFSDIIENPLTSVSDLSFSFSSSTVWPYGSSLNNFVVGVMSPSFEILYSKICPLSLSGQQSGNYFVNSSDCMSFLKDYVSSGKSARIFIAYLAYESDGSFSRGVRGGDSSSVIIWPSTVVSSTDVYLDYVFTQGMSVSRIFDATDDFVIEDNVYLGSQPVEPVQAYVFRHYEQICNYYFRNDKNNPYVLNGEPQYNKFIPSMASGPDDNFYDFHYANWELDRLTSAVQSPQFGEAPLVGLTYQGNGDIVDLTFEASEPDSSPKQYTVKVALEDDRLAEIVDFDEGIPSANLRRLQSRMNAGISINDLRVTNSFQHFLENVLRRGLRYRNQLKSHFGVSVDYPDIDIPQYIGGFSGELTVGKTTNMADSPNAGLGDFVGQLSGLISQQNTIKHYCPEHGFIIGIASIVPVPVYSQVTAKHMLKTDPFDYFVPEFGKIGFVPVHYSEVCPMQTAVGQDTKDVFGYQKAWYDYFRAFDEAHCDFRTSLKDFVLQRTFADRPTLAADFVKVNPEQLNDVFCTQNIADAYDSKAKFMCNLWTTCIMTRPIPMPGQASLE